MMTVIAGRRWPSVVMSLVLLTCLAGCGGSSSEQPADGSPSGPAAGFNILPITIGGGTSLCTGIVNQPCVSVTICIPETLQCQTVDDILLDTGSIGLRIFRSVLTLDFSSRLEQDSQGNQIGECVIFGTAALWGPIAAAGIILGHEPEVVAPIQLIDASFAGQSASVNPCNQPVEDTPANARLNGILGIDAFSSDDGYGLYFSCTSQGCPPVIIQPLRFVQNPIALLPADNNGYVVSLPPVGDSGALVVTGELIMGIGTQSNNTPPAVSVLTRNPSTGRITTSYKGVTYPAFLDTGSTFLFFPDATIPLCQTIDGAFCPPSSLNLSATNHGLNQVSTVVAFQVANAESLRETGNGVFDNIGGHLGPANPFSDEFDWGLPFFLGRTLYAGMDGKNSMLGIGPYWAH